MNNGTLLLRATIGPFFVGHGAQKLFGVAGGAGLQGTGQFFDSLGIKPGVVQAGLAGSAELLGGAGLTLGFRTPLAASAIVATMTTAIQRVHLKNGWNVQNQGFEYNAVLIAGAVAIAERGPGKLSLDALRGKQRSGTVAGLFALGAGVGGALVAGRASAYFGGEDLPVPVPVVEPEPEAAAVGVETVEAPAGTLPSEPLPDSPLGGSES
jgi:putative oxidoreductase